VRKTLTAIHPQFGKPVLLLDGLLPRLCALTQKLFIVSILRRSAATTVICHLL